MQRDRHVVRTGPQVRNQLTSSRQHPSLSASPVSIIQPRQTLGLWKVELGNVGLHVGDYTTPGGAGNAVDLNGTRAGSMFQTLSVRLGVERFQFTMTRPLNWSKADMKWELNSSDFLARAPQVSLRFSSDSTGIADGPEVIGSTGVVSRMFAGLVQGSSADASSPFRFS